MNRGCREDNFRVHWISVRNVKLRVFWLSPNLLSWSASRLPPFWGASLLDGSWKNCEDYHQNLKLNNFPNLQYRRDRWIATMHFLTFFVHWTTFDSCLANKTIPVKSTHCAARDSRRDPPFKNQSLGFLICTSFLIPFSLIFLQFCAIFFLTTSCWSI